MVIDLQPYKLVTWIEDQYARLYLRLLRCQEIHLISRVSLLLNAVCISCIIDRSWAIHESTGRRPDCEEVQSSLLWKWLNKELYITLSKILLKMGSNLIRR